MPSDVWATVKGLLLDGDRYERATWRLHIMAVKEGLKPAFFYSEAKSLEKRSKFSANLRKVGFSCMDSEGRKFKDMTPLEISRFASHDGSGVWVFNGNSESNYLRRLNDYKEGVISQGELLGYPQCCVSWYAGEHEVPFGMTVIRKFNNIGAAPLSEKSIQYYRSTRRLDETLFEFLTGEPGERLLTDLRESNYAYPFVPHIACPACRANGNDSASGSMNREYSQLARSLGSLFYEKITQLSRSL